MNKDCHFQIGAWIDYVRGLDSAAHHAEIESHLASGCAVCAEMAQFLKKLSGAGLRAAEEQAPEAWSRKAEQIFQERILHPIQMLPVRRAVPAAFKFSAEPVPVRAGEPFGRHMRYETPECNVILTLEEGANPNELSLVGQIVDARKDDAAVSLLPVFILANNKLVANTSSNAHGEFQFALSRRRNLLLSFPFEGFRIDVMLDDFMSQS
jgi:hypothetical protein